VIIHVKRMSSAILIKSSGYVKGLLEVDTDINAIIEFGNKIVE